MKIDQPGQFALLRKSVVELPSTRPLHVGSGGGTLWLTLDGDPRDLVLEPGERVLVEAPGRVLAYALEDALLEVTDARERVEAPRAWAAREALAT